MWIQKASEHAKLGLQTGRFLSEVLYMSTHLHPPDINGEYGEKEEDLKKEVRQESDDREQTELLDERGKCQETTRQDQHLCHQILEDVPTLFADTYK